jgi:hypothetical protein
METECTGSNSFWQFTIETTYTGTVRFLNEAVTPLDDITLEVKAEGVDHHRFFRRQPQ